MINSQFDDSEKNNKGYEKDYFSNENDFKWLNAKFYAHAIQITRLNWREINAIDPLKLFGAIAFITFFLGYW